jgi:MoxR-like ATPase
MKTNQPLFKLLHGLYYTKVPVVIFGNVGIGKTSAIKQLGKVLGVTTITKSSSKITDVDLGGIPYLIDVVDDGAVVNTDSVNVNTHKEVRISVPTFSKALNKDPNGILFFDELCTASIDIQKQMLSLIQDCELNDFSIPESTFRVCAANYSNVQGNKQLSLALNNRLCHIHVDANPDTFLKGFVSGFTNYELAKINSEHDAEKKLIQYKIAIENFLTIHPNYICDQPDDITDEYNQAFPTPRAWENVAKVLSILDQNDPDYIDTIICGIVGDGIGKLFQVHLKSTELLAVDLREYVGKESEFFLPHPDDHSEVYQIASSLMAYFDKDPMKYLDLWTRIMNLLHNKDGKYGNYTPYDNIVMTFCFASITNITKADPTGKSIRRLCGNDKEWSTTYPDKVVDDWNILMAISAQS